MGVLLFEGVMKKACTLTFIQFNSAWLGLRSLGIFNNNMYVNLRLDLYVFTYIDTSSLIVSEFERWRTKRLVEEKFVSVLNFPNSSQHCKSVIGIFCY